MSNARDKANIPALNFSSTGIDDNATSTAITINSSEEIGIGTTSQTSNANLTLSGKGFTAGGVDSGSIAFGHTPAYQGRIYQENATSIFYIENTYASGSGDIRFKANGSERVTIEGTGNVGIGTSSPSEQLEISGTGTQTLKIDRTDASTAGAITINSANDSNYIYNLTSKNLVLGTNNSARLTIDGSGRVGIGTNSPNYKLSISENANNFLQFSQGGDASAGSLIGRSSSKDLRIQNSENANTVFWTNNTERMRIDSSGNVGIGTSSPAEKLDVYRSGSGITTRFGKDSIFGELRVAGDSVGFTGTRTAGTADNAISGYYINNDINNGTSRFEYLTLKTVGTERMRIDSSGNVLVGKTSQGQTVIGCELLPIGVGIFTRNNGEPLFADRQGSDGVLVTFAQATVTEGTISVSGSTVSYNGFTGTHWSRFTDNSTPNILRGTVLESLDEMCDWYNLEFDVTTQDADGNDVTSPQKIPHVLVDGQSNGDVITYNHEGTDVQATIVKEGDVKHMMSKVSDNSDAKNVYGVFVAYDLDGEGYNDFYVASVGSFVVRIKANETIAKGDLLQSNGDGTAKVQTDDNVKSSSFAKVLSTTIIETYEDGSYLVPCSLMC